MLTRTANGYIPGRSEDVIAVAQQFNYLGSFDVTSHSGAWDHLQRVPLVLAGPRIARNGWVLTPTTLADVYPTVGELLDVDLEPRDGHLLVDAVGSDGPTPRLVVVVMWDGVGRNVLDRWPEAFPNLALLESRGTSYVDATLGSSPSITPATHATLGTGSYPVSHGVTSINYRGRGGKVRTAFAGLDPRMLRLPTFADQIDRANRNRSKVGLLGWRGWHIPMMGLGASLAGGDKDQLGIIGYEQRVFGRADFYETPPYLPGFPGLYDHLNSADVNDGRRDGLWMEHDVDADQDNPGWVDYQLDMILTFLRRERYGADRVPDLFFTNFKATDRVGHRYSMDSPEMELVLAAQDRALGRLVRFLNERVPNHVLIVTADHGHTPSTATTSSWPIVQRELEADLDRAFDVPADQTLSQVTTAVGLFLDPDVMRSLGITNDHVAAFLDGYTIRDNWAEAELPAGYEERGEEEVFAAAWAGERMQEVLDCAGV